MKTSTTFFLILLLCALATSCKKDGGGTDDATQKPDLSVQVDAGKLLQLVNDVRAKGCNCGDEWMNPTAAVKWNQVIAETAYGHSLDMETNHFFAHSGSTGTNSGQRLTNKGYNWAMCGENIAQGQETEEEVMASWLNSPGHCKNIMNTYFKEMGVGRSGNYWTQVFAVSQ